MVIDVDLIVVIIINDDDDDDVFLLLFLFLVSWLVNWFGWRENLIIENKISIHRYYYCEDDFHREKQNKTK